MSKRSLNLKKANKLRKAMRRTPPKYIDLVQYLTDRRVGYKRLSKRQAREKLLAGRVMVGSHRVGRLEVELLGEKRWVLDHYLPADKRIEIFVLP